MHIATWIGALPGASIAIHNMMDGRLTRTLPQPFRFVDVPPNVALGGLGHNNTSRFIVRAFVRHLCEQNGFETRIPLESGDFEPICSKDVF